MMYGMRKEERRERVGEREGRELEREKKITK